MQPNQLSIQLGDLELLLLLLPFKCWDIGMQPPGKGDRLLKLAMKMTWE